MPVPVARVVMIVSLALLVGAGAMSVGGASAEPRADLAGQAVIAPPTTTTTSPVAEVDRDAVDLAPDSPVEAPPPAPGRPSAILIPSLGVGSPVVSVGLEPDGAMEIPGPSEAGWYLHGPRPGGAAGNAVIAAHIDFNGERGVFFDLRTLDVGAEIAVADDAGMTHSFVVTERFQVDKDDLPVDDLFVNNGPAGLTLITCGGEYDSSGRHYDDNIVVRAVPA